MSLAPIILFAYNRPLHLQETLTALKNNHLASQSVLYIYLDGAKEGVSMEQLDVIKEVQTLCERVSWCKEVHLIRRATNFGLAKNVIEGITEVINKHDKAIILEDDLVTSPHFLSFCNEGLDMYQHESNVFSINAYQFPMEINEATTFLSPLATSSWGWATWKDRWKHFKHEPSAKELIQSSKFLSGRFNLGDYDYATMLDNKNSWAIRWYYTAFLRNAVGVFPTKSLVYNNGFDNSGKHCGEVDYSQVLHQEPILLEKQEEINFKYYQSVFNFLMRSGEKKPKSKSFKNRFKRKMRFKR